MARNYAQISTAIWRDDDFKALTIGAQHVYFLLATQPDISAAGALPLTLGRWSSRAVDSDIDTLEAALAELVRHRFIYIDRDTEELLVRSFVKWDGGYGNEKRRPVIQRNAQEIESRALRAALAVEFQKLGLSTEGLPLPLDSAPEPPSTPEVEQPSEMTFPQGNRLSDRASGGASPSDGVVVTQALAVDPQPTTHIPQPSAPAATVAVAEAPPAPSAPAPEIISSTPVNASAIPAQRWAEGDRKPTTPTAIHSRTAALFPLPKPAAVESWMEIHQVIYRWLQANGYETLGLDEVRQIHTQLCAAHPGKALRYLITVIGNGGCAAYAQTIRKARHKKVEALILDMQANLPQCPHGTPGGDHPHPTTGILLCVQCRLGAPATVVEDATDPDVQAALDTYRLRRGNDIYFQELLNTTQQIEAFLDGGATLDQVLALAEIAGEQRISLIQAAGVAA